MNDRLLTVQDVMKKLEVSQATVLNWINNGYLPSFKDGIGGKNSRFLIHEEDLEEFLKSDNYTGHPEDIRSGRPFGRIQDLECCYPVNLIQRITGVKRECENEDFIPENIWRYDIQGILDCMGRLCDRDRKVIEFRYHFGMTLDEVGKIFGRHRETIRQIEVKALRKLRHAIIKENLYVVPRKEFCEIIREREFYKAGYERLLRLTDSLWKNEAPKEQKQETPEYSKIGIEDLNFSTRAYNCLRRHGLNSIGDLLTYDQHQHEHKIDSDGKPYGWNTWRTIRNLGRKSLIEIYTKLFDYCGYRIQEYDIQENAYSDFLCDKEENQNGSQDA